MAVLILVAGLGAIAVIAGLGIVIIALAGHGSLSFRESVAWTARGFLEGFTGYCTPALRELKKRTEDRDDERENSRSGPG